MKRTALLFILALLLIVNLRSIREEKKQEIQSRKVGGSKQ